MSFVSWGVTSLTRYVLFIETTVAIPFYVAFLFLNRSQGTLTPSWALQMIFIDAGIWALVGAATWFMIVVPLKKQYPRHE